MAINSVSVEYPPRKLIVPASLIPDNALSCFFMSLPYAFDLSTRERLDRFQEKLTPLGTTDNFYLPPFAAQPSAGANDFFFFAVWCSIRSGFF